MIYAVSMFLVFFKLLKLIWLVCKDPAHYSWWPCQDRRAVSEWIHELCLNENCDLSPVMKLSNDDPITIASPPGPTQRRASIWSKVLWINKRIGKLDSQKASAVAKSWHISMIQQFESCTSRSRCFHKIEMPINMSCNWCQRISRTLKCSQSLNDYAQSTSSMRHMRAV